MTNAEELELRVRNYWHARFKDQQKVEWLYEDVFIDAVNECITGALLDMGFKTFHIIAPEDLNFDYRTEITFSEECVAMTWDLEDIIGDSQDFDIQKFRLVDKGFNSLKKCQKEI